MTVLDVATPLGAAAFTVALWALNAKISQSFDERIKGYVTREEFQEYQRRHKEWGDEVIRRLDEKIEVSRKESLQMVGIAEENNKLIKQLMERIR